MAKLEKIAIQTLTVSCHNSTCKAVFTAKRNEFIPQGGRYDENDKFHNQYVVRCPFCGEATWIDDPDFNVRYVTPAQLKKEERMAIATNIRKTVVSFFKEVSHLFDRVTGLD